MTIPRQCLGSNSFKIESKQKKSWPRAIKGFSSKDYWRDFAEEKKKRIHQRTRTKWKRYLLPLQKNENDFLPQAKVIHLSPPGHEREKTIFLFKTNFKCRTPTKVSEVGVFVMPFHKIWTSIQFLFLFLFLSSLGTILIAF